MRELRIERRISSGADTQGASFDFVTYSSLRSSAQVSDVSVLAPGHADECVHVEYVARLELSDRPGRDTRPKDDAEHAKLHKK
jgi:hypothetical protein